MKRREGDHFSGRIIATTASGKRLYLAYDHSLSLDELHRKAAEALCRRLGWEGKLIAGGTKRGKVFVFADSEG